MKVYVDIGSCALAYTSAISRKRRMVDRDVTAAGVLYNQIILALIHRATEKPSIEVSTYETVQAPPAIDRRHDLHSQMPTASRLTLFLPQNVQV